MDRQRRAPLRDRSVQIALFKKRGPEIVMRVGKIRTELDRLAQMNDRLIELTFAGEHVADAVVNEGET